MGGGERGLTLLSAVQWDLLDVKCSHKPSPDWFAVRVLFKFSRERLCPGMAVS